jgi:hypothetical protein
LIDGGTVQFSRAFVTMYQLEVKRWLVHHRYRPSDGWLVHVHVDEMERANGGKQAEGKLERARAAESELKALGVILDRHPEFGPTDIVAEHPKHGIVFIEVEGESVTQKQQALYSALGQLAIQMNGEERKYVIAFPDDRKWAAQANKITQFVRSMLTLSCVLVSANGVRDT